MNKTLLFLCDINILMEGYSYDIQTNEIIKLINNIKIISSKSSCDKIIISFFNNRYCNYAAIKRVIDEVKLYITNKNIFLGPSFTADGIYNSHCEEILSYYNIRSFKKRLIDYIKKTNPLGVVIADKSLDYDTFHKYSSNIDTKQVLGFSSNKTFIKNGEQLNYGYRGVLKGLNLTIESFAGNHEIQEIGQSNNVYIPKQMIVDDKVYEEYLQTTRFYEEIVNYFYYKGTKEGLTKKDIINIKSLTKEIESLSKKTLTEYYYDYSNKNLLGLMYTNLEKQIKDLKRVIENCKTIFDKYSKNNIEDIINQSSILPLAFAHNNNKYIIKVNHRFMFKFSCQFHLEKTPSMQINCLNNFFFCYGCGAGGNILNYVMKLYDYNFIQAVEFVAAVFNIPLPNNPFCDSNEKVFIQNMVNSEEYSSLLELACSKNLNTTNNDNIQERLNRLEYFSYQKTIKDGIVQDFNYQPPHNKIYI